MPLPDVDEQSYNTYSAEAFARNARARISALGAEMPEVGEMAHLPSVTQPGRMPFPQPQMPTPQMPQFPTPQMPGMPQLPWQQQGPGPTTPPATPQIQAPPAFQPLPRPPGAGAPSTAFAPSLGVTTPRQPVPEPVVVDTGPPLAGPPRIPGRMPQPDEPTWTPPGAQPLGRTFGAQPGGAVNPQPSTNEVRQYITQAAAARGIDPDIALRVAQSEGGFEAARRGTFKTGSSWWPFQLHYGGPGYEQFGTTAGMGNSFTKETGYAPGDPNAWQAATDYALDRVKQGGWGPWYGAKAQGITGMMGVDADGPSVGGLHAPSVPRQTPGTKIANAPDQSGRVFPLTAKPSNAPSSTYHSEGGSDLMAPRGTPVLSMTGGTVVDVYTDNGNHQAGGNALLIRGDDGLDYYYAHFDQPPGLKAGQRVETGVQIGAVGNSGNAWKGGEGDPHLHIGIGHGISNGVGSEGGLGQKFNAQELLTGLQSGIGQATGGEPTDDDFAVPGSLDRQREQMMSSLAPQVAAQIPKAVSPFLDTGQGFQARPTAEIAHLPSAQPAQVAKSDNPLEELGNTIGSAIQTAISAALGGLGGGPPGGEDRRKQAEEALTKLRQSPFPEPGRTPEDVVGRATGMYLEPPKDVREAVERAMSDVERRGVPSPGPGGALGILRPGKSLRELNPFSQGVEGAALERALGGGVGELADIASSVRGGVGGLASDAMTGIRNVAGREGVLPSNLTEPMRRFAAATAPDVERLAGPGARIEGAMLRSNVADIATAAASHVPAEESAGKALSPTRGPSAWDGWVRKWSNQEVDLDHVQEDFQKLTAAASPNGVGRRLRDDEMVAFLARVDPTHRALVATENAIGPALRSVPQRLWEPFKELISLRADISTAKGLAKKKERDYLKGGIAPRTEEELKEALEDWTRIQDEVDEADMLRQQVQQGTARTRESIGLDAAQKRYDAGKARLEAATEVARQTQIERARAAKMEGPGAQVVTQVEKRDLDIAENDLKRLERRYKTLFDRDPDDTYLDKLARQMGRLETRIGRMRTDMGATSVAREEKIIGRAEQAAQSAAERPTVTPTPEYATARIRLRYEQENLARLQAAQERGVKGLSDDLARAKKRLDSAQADVDQATQDLPEAAKAQGWAQLEGRVFSGDRRYPQLVEQLAKLRGGLSPEDLAILDKAGDDVFGFSRTLRDEMVDSGAWKSSMVDEMEDLYDDWLPTEHLDYGSVDDTANGMRVGQRLSMGDVSPRAYTDEGSAGEVEDRIISQLRNADRTYRTAAKTRTVRALINAQANKPGGLKRIAPDVKTYNANKDTMYPPDYTPKSGKNERVITGWIDGEREQWVTDNPMIHAAVEKAPQGEMSGIWNWFAKGGDVTRELAVSRNPFWLAMNIVRDLGTYLGVNTIRGAAADPGKAIGSAALQGGPALATAIATDEDDPQRGQKMAAALAGGIGARAAVGKHLGPNLLGEYFRALPDAFSGFNVGRYGGQGVQELLLGGGGMRGGGVFGSKTKDVEESLNRLRPGSVPLTGMEELKDFVDHAAFGFVKMAGDRIELAPRVATMRVAQQRGASKLESIMKARDVTVDFDKGGSWVKATNRIIPFLNASVQGTTNIMRLAKDHPVAFTIAGSSLVGGPALYAEQHNHSTPELERDYADVPDYVKRQGIVIMLGGEASVDKNGNRLPNYFVVPTAGFTPFVEAAREAYSRGTGRGGRNPLELAATVGAELSPVQFTNPAEATFGMAQIPGASTAAQLFMNRDLFRNSMIATERTDENASALGKLIAEPLTDVVSKVPGFGAARIHPSQVDYVAKDVGGGIGQALLGASDEIANRVAGTPLRSNALSETPIIGGPLGRFVRTTGGQRASEAREAERMLTPSAREALRKAGIDWEPTSVPSEIKDVKLRYEEQERLQALTNRYVDDAVQRAIRTESWAKYDTKARESFLNRQVAAAREKARGEILSSISGESRAARRKSGTSKE